MRISVHKKKTIEELLHKGDMCVNEIARAAGVSDYTVYRIKNALEDHVRQQDKAKITEEKRKEVEQLLQNSDKTLNQIARIVGVSKSSVYNIRNAMENNIRQQEQLLKREPVKNFRTRNVQGRYYISHY